MQAMEARNHQSQHPLPLRRHHLPIMVRILHRLNNHLAQRHIRHPFRPLIPIVYHLLILRHIDLRAQVLPIVILLLMSG